MSPKLTVATTWLQGCSGCHVSMLDMHQGLLDIFQILDLRFSPIMDLKEMPEVDVGIVEGAVGTDENEEVLSTFRARSKTLVALGTCAAFGGITGLRNLYKLEEVLARGYRTTESTVDGHVPAGPELPRLQPRVRALSQVVAVDAVIPGCPPLPSMIKRSLEAIATGNEIPSVAHTRNLCVQCDRRKDKMLVAKRDFVTDAVLSPHELDFIDPGICFLEQGVLCMGPATSEGCEGRCLKGNMPCRGCMGPPGQALEQGARIINAVASVLPAGALMFQEDVVGTGYRYSLPVSMMPGRMDDTEEGS